MQMIYYLYTPTVKRVGGIELVPQSGDMWRQRQGFRSVFGFPEETAKHIVGQDSIRRLHDFDVYAEEILVDFDDNVEAAMRLDNYLRTREYAYKRYGSGNRSIHFHIKAAPITGRNVPAAHKKWAQEHAPGCDLSIYHASAIFRLPGTWHEKHAGQRKELQYRQDGRVATTIPPPPKPMRAPTSSGALAEEKLARGLQRTQDEGGRRCYAWYLGVCAFDAGVPFDQALGLVIRWNNEFANPPLPEEAIWQKVNEAYGERSRAGRPSRPSDAKTPSSGPRESIQTKSALE